MQTERRVAANPQTKPTDFGCESADKWLLPSTSTIAICYYYSAQKLILILQSHGGWKADSTYFAQFVRYSQILVENRRFNEYFLHKVNFAPGNIPLGARTPKMYIGL